MKIALQNEVSQSSKNQLIFNTLNKVCNQYGHSLYNVAMTSESDAPLTYLHLGLQAYLLLNSGAVDFIVTGCGTGQGALMSLNSYPGVYCGYCIEPTDAYLFKQINQGNALSLPFAKGFGWGAEINLENIFEKLFQGQFGEGYPTERKEFQNRLVSDFKSKKDVLYLNSEALLDKVDQDFLKEVLTPQCIELIKNSEESVIKRKVQKCINLYHISY